jgi:hypothetical protein
MSDPDRGRLSVGVNKDGASVELEASGVDRLSHALADFVSPATEAFGIVGDYFRSARAHNVLRIVSHAKRQAKANGIKLNPVALKFLAPWLEGASLEEESDEDLSDLWAGILISESSKSGPANSFFRDALRQMNVRHVDFLSYICNVNRTDIKKFTKDRIDINKSTDNIFGSKLYIPIMRGEKSHADAADELLRHREAGILVYEIEVSSGRDSYRSKVSKIIYRARDPYFADFETDMTVAVLEKFGFVALGTRNIEFSDPDFFDLNQSGDDKVHGTVNYCALSPFGLQFMIACAGGNQ